MRSLLKIVFWLVVLGIIALLAIIFVPVQRSAPIAENAGGGQAAAGKGAYLAVLADCAACHTNNADEPMGGGKAVESPFGNIYASNISPSREYGIGDYSLEDFRAALRDGLRPDGSQLYPAMPYENYRKLTDEDIVALYQYFMHEVKPVDKPIPQTALIFPFNQRWGIRMWNWFALGQETGFQPRFNNAQLDRGAYIVESLAHCGACHTPRDIIFRQSGLDSSRPKFMTGGQVGDWFAPDLRGPDSAAAKWTADDLKMYLLTGRNRYTAAVGPMNEAVEHSLQYMQADDADAVVAYLQHIRRPGEPSKPELDPKSTIDMLSAANPDMPLGARLYLDNCGACHFVTGKGAAEVFPQLDGAPIINAKNPAGLINVILAGSRLPSTALRPEDLTMPGFAWRLNDEETAELVNFLRSSWTNNAPPVSAAAVAKVRAHLNAQ